MYGSLPCLITKAGWWHTYPSENYVDSSVGILKLLNGKINGSCSRPPIRFRSLQQPTTTRDILYSFHGAGIFTNIWGQFLRATVGKSSIYGACGRSRDRLTFWMLMALICWSNKGIHDKHPTPTWFVIWNTTTLDDLGCGPNASDKLIMQSRSDTI